MLSSVFKIVPFFTIYSILRELIRCYSAGEKFSFGSVKLLVVITAVSALLYGVCAYASAMLSHGAAFDILYDLRMKLMEKMGKISSGYYTANTQGSIKKLLIEDVEQIEGFIAHSMCEVSAAIATPLLTIVVLLIVDWRLTLVSLLPIICSFIILAMALKKPDGAAHQKNMADSKAKMEGTIIEYIHGMSVIKIFGGTTNAFKRFERDMNDFTKAVHDTAYYNANGMGLYYAFFGAQVLFLLPAAIIMLNNSASYSEVLPKVIFFLVVCAGLKEPLENMMNVSIDSTKINVGLRRIDDLLAEPEIALVGEGRKPESFGITFDEVSFAYPGSSVKACDGVSFNLPQGSCNALVGPSGGGKSTIAQLLLHFYEIDSGSIKIGGVDIKEITHAELVKNIAYVFQDSFIFNDSIEQNIRMGNDKASIEEVVAAAKAANIHETIVGLPEGYSTVVSDSTGLSGGEKQRIAIARAILKNAPIVVLDEATAYADAENESKIQDAFSKLSKGRTVIMIAHRLTTIQNADNILVMDKGCLKAMGRHDELMANCELYRNMVNANDRRDSWSMRKVEKNG
ncbi:ABC transporter ATP-binding protein [Ruminococcus sp.]|uniref:ABC transporter ATP-binding protein n=1 Tax=Ruminococcus sp. TaxID=41978 RepID=UPI0025F20A3E|nr:ABC transporter ATP-binding protein [Ruminococcus sp.]